MSGQHPSGLDLSRFADGELREPRARDVARHLEECAECRGYVDFIHELAAAAEEVSTDRPSAIPALEPGYDLADEVLRRRRAGERVTLDVPAAAAEGAGYAVGRVGHPGHRFGAAWRIGLGIAAAFVLLALAAVYLFEAPPVAAGHSELDFGTDLAPPGSTLDVAYTPAVFLARYDSLRLRVRTRTEDTPFPGHAGVIGELRTTTLRRDADGRFRGALAVEPDEVYMAGAVEDFSGENVDTNLGRLWDLFVSADSTPSTAVLASRYRTLEAVNWVQAVTWAKGLATRYPDNPLGWLMLWRYQDRIESAPPSDSLVAFHRAKLRELIRREAERGTTVDDLLLLRAYARWLDEPSLADSLLAEAARLDPGNYVVAGARLPDPRDGWSAWLDRAEQVWAASDKTDDSFVINALYVAGEAGDLAAVRRWVGRGRALPYLSTGTMAARLDPYGFAAPVRVELRREWLLQLDEMGERRRPLAESISEFEAWRQDRIRRTKSDLGRDLAIVGDTAESRALLASAAATAWQPSLLRPYADFMLAGGDTTAALDAIALLAVDPVSGADDRARYEAVLERRVEDRDRFLQQASKEYGRHIRQTVDFGLRLPARTEVDLADGSTTTVDRFLSGPVTLLAIFEPEYPDIETWIAEVVERVHGMPENDRPSLLLVAKGAAPELAARFDAVDMVTDRDLDLAQRVHAWSDRDFVVVDRRLDATGPSDLDDALRIAGALRRE